MTKHISNKNARPLVEAEQEFEGSNLFARRGLTDYIVYSYGTHWPLVAKVKGVWYVNTEKTSASTQRQLSQCRPRHIDVVEVDRLGIRTVINAA